MKRTLTIGVGVTLVGVFTLLAGVWALGSSLPRSHTASASVDIAAPIDEVWSTVRDYDRLHQWAPDIAALQRLEDAEGRPVYRMESGGDALSFTLVDERPPSRLTVDLTTDSAVFGGRWTYTLEGSEVGTQVMITEEGWLNPPLFRLWMSVTGGHDDTVQAHVHALKAHLEG